MRPSDVQSQPSEEEIEQQRREEDRRKPQQKLIEEPFVYHKLETHSYYDENREPQSDRVLLDTVDIRNLEDHPHRPLKVVSDYIPDLQFDTSEVEDVDDEYENESNVNMTVRFVAHNLTLGDSE